MNLGSNYTGAESSNILIRNLGVLGESNTIHIGSQGPDPTDPGVQTTCFIAGITGVSVSGSAVQVSASGQLGVVVSSSRYKTDIQTLSNDSSSIYHLRPVSFSYKNSPNQEKQIGLIAEEVALVYPELVVYNHQKEPESVKYHSLPVLLLNEDKKHKGIIDDLMCRVEKLEQIANA